MIKLLSLSICFLLMGLVACKSDKPKQEANYYTTAEPLIRLNQRVLEANLKLVDSLITANGWKMKTIGAGIWLEVLKQGKGEALVANQTVTIAYKTYLIDGTLCYSSDSLGLKSFRVGKGEIERGLDAALLKLKVGDEAQIICLPHVAFGVAGDQKNIPPMAVVRYEVEVKDAKETK